MAQQVADRVKETTTTTGTGGLTLAGAMTGFRSFSSVCSIGDTCFYALQAVNGSGVPTGVWEVGLGTYGPSANQLQRTVVISSSNSNALVTLAAGTTQVWIDVPGRTFQGPAFSVYQSTAQTLASGTPTKLQFQTELFDTAAAFDVVTNYRFQPAVAGYYQINGGFYCATLAVEIIAYIYKNGSLIQRGNDITGMGSDISGLVLLNGATDYVELWGYVGTGQALATGQANTYFQGIFTRGL